MSVLGLDLSLTSTGWAAPDGKSGVIAVKPKGMKRLELILGELSVLVGISMGCSEIEHPVELIVIEGYSFGSKGQGLTGLAELGGCVRQLLWMEGIPYVEATPGQLKKFVLGTGVGKKDEIRLGVYKRWGMEFKTNDEVDAFALAKIGEALLDQKIKLNKKQQEVTTDLKGKIIKR